MKYLCFYVLIFTLVLACKPKDALEQSNKLDARALKEWHRNETMVREALKGSFDPDKFLEAVIFFKDLTGISIRGNTTTFGLIPDQHTQEDFGRVMRWYIENKYRLVWDEADKSVRLRAIESRLQGEEARPRTLSETVPSSRSSLMGKSFVSTRRRSAPVFTKADSGTFQMTRCSSRAPCLEVQERLEHGPPVM